LRIFNYELIHRDRYNKLCRAYELQLRANQAKTWFRFHRTLLAPLWDFIFDVPGPYQQAHQARDSFQARLKQLVDK